VDDNLFTYSSFRGAIVLHAPPLAKAVSSRQDIYLGIVLHRRSTGL
jgi:hypothetical protein